MNASSPLPDDDPRLVYFNSWLESEVGKNAFYWLKQPNLPEVNIKGSLWEAFMAGREFERDLP